MNEKRSAHGNIRDYVIGLDDRSATLERVGGKGASLARLVQAGFPVPGGFHVTTAAYRQFVDDNNLQGDLLAALLPVDASRPTTLEAASQAVQALFAAASIPPAIANAIVEAYARLPGADPAVAVRSSATAEDLPDASFAGQQETYLNVSSPDALLEATKRCWASLWTARAIGYRARQGIAPEQVALAVVVQLLVPAEAAGILFTADPVSGRRDRVVISAAWGLGEAVVGGAVTPDSLTVDKHSGEVLQRETAQKAVMTVRVNGGTAERTVPDGLRSVPVLSNSAAAELADLGTAIEALYAMPMDIEWVLADGKFAIVQARPITALPEYVAPQMEVPPADTWELPDPKARYMRTSVIDFMPDPLSPLFATLGFSEMNRGLRRLMSELARRECPLSPQFLLTINEYGYMTVNFTPREWWWLLRYFLPTFPRIIREGLARWRDEVRPRYVATVTRWEEQMTADLPPAVLWQGAQEVWRVAVDHLNALQAGPMGAAAGSELLFTKVYERLVQRPGDPPASAFLMGYNSTPIQAEKAIYDLAQWCRDDETLCAYLLQTPAEIVAKTHERPAAVAPEVWQAWQERVNEHLQRFGHLIYDLDFAAPLPLDDPTPLVEACKMYLRGEGRDPYARQQAAEQRRVEATETTLARVKRVRGWLLRKSLGFAQSMAEVREDAIADIGLGYPLLRRMLVALGGDLHETGAVLEASDIFWLEEHDLDRAVAYLEQGKAAPDFTALVAERKVRWQAAKQVTPPPQLPPSDRFMGFKVDSFLATAEEGHADRQIKGQGASPGQVTARARVLHGPEDFDQMEPGEILVAGITTPAWTPLFAMAAGVVTDIGGPLSHGSIVAREYGIPAVLGTGVATRRISSGQMITVDGSSGTVRLEDTR